MDSKVFFRQADGYSIRSDKTGASGKFYQFFGTKSALEVDQNDIEWFQSSKQFVECKKDGSPCGPLGTKNVKESITPETLGMKSEKKNESDEKSPEKKKVVKKQNLKESTKKE